MTIKSNILSKYSEEWRYLIKEYFYRKRDLLQLSDDKVTQECINLLNSIDKIECVEIDDETIAGTTSLKNKSIKINERKS